MSIRFALVCAVAASFAAPSPATILTYQATGDFLLATGSLAALQGSAYTYQFAYDTEAENRSGLPNFGDYEILWTRVTTPLGTLSSGKDDSFATIGITSQPYFDFTGYQYGNSADTVYGLTYEVPSISTTSLPADLISATNVIVRRDFHYVVMDKEGNVTGTASGRTASLQAVPEPATIAAVAAGLVGCARRRRAHRS